MQASCSDYVAGHCIVCLVYDNGKLPEPMEFLSVAPIVPIVIFIAAIFWLCYTGILYREQKILKCNLAEALQK